MHALIAVLKSPHRVKSGEIGSVTSEISKGVCGIFARTRQITGPKLSYLTRYLSNHWTDLYRTLSLADIYVKIIKVALVLQLLKGSCYGIGNQLANVESD